MKSPDDPLDEQLATWRVTPEFQSDFNREVWRKIAASSSARETSFWQNLIAAFFVTPRFATISALTIALFSLSLGSASIAAHNANSKRWTILENRYAESIDPLMRSTMKE